MGIAKQWKNNCVSSIVMTYFLNAGQLANSICARTIDKTVLESYLAFVWRVIFTTQLAFVQDAGNGASIDQLLSLISEVELNSTRWQQVAKVKDYTLSSVMSWYVTCIWSGTDGSSGNTIATAARYILLFLLHICIEMFNYYVSKNRIM